VVGHRGAATVPTSGAGRRAALLLAGLLGSVWGCSDDPAAPGAQFDPPETGFEQRGGASFTTHGEELTFLASVEAESDRVRTSEIGSSVQGRPLHLVRIAHPQPAADEVIASGPAILIIGSQHGNEPAGREAALKFLRDLALVEEGELRDLLSGVTILVIPSANPDGRVANTRRNAADVDVNRDHLHLNSPEARAIAAVLRDFRPDIVIDAHERPSGSIPDMELLWPRNLNVYGPVQALSRDLVEEQLFDDLEASGHSVDLYGPGAGPPGDENETILRNAVGLRHSMGLLTESAGSQPAEERVAIQLEVFRSVLRFRQDRASEIVAAVTAAPDAKATAGANRSEPFHLFGADNDPSDPDQVLDPPPCGYRLGSAQVAALASTLSLWALQTEDLPGDESLLAMDQPFMTVIPLLVDSRARAPVVDGVPVDSELECAALPSGQPFGSGQPFSSTRW